MMLKKILLLVLCFASLASASNVFGNPICARQLQRRIHLVCSLDHCTTGLDVINYPCDQPLSDDELVASCCPQELKTARILETEIARQDYLSDFDEDTKRKKRFVLIRPTLQTPQPTERFYKSCGQKLIKRVFRLCPSGCTTSHDIATVVCSSPFTDSALAERCCPKQDSA